MKTSKITALLFLFFLQVTIAQPTFQVTLLEGTANVQRSNKKSWESISLGDELYDNDIVETFFQTKIIMQYGDQNAVVLGSNTRALLNIKEREFQDRKRLDLNTTLFSGGILIKVMSDSRASIYTANAVSEIDSGVISAVVESKTGYTGFQVLNGSAKARNIAQQQGKLLSSGLTTIVLPGKEPTAPLYITYRHVAVLKHFFGDEFIDREIEAAGLEPTEDVSSANRLSLSQQMQQQKRESDTRMHKRLFSQDKIWGVILDDRAKKRKYYEPIDKPLRVFKNKGELGFTSSIGMAGGTAYPLFSLNPSFYFPKVTFGLRLPLAKNYTGKLSLNMGSAAGIFDKIGFMTIGDITNLRYGALGPIKDYTIARGMVVNNFQNKNRYTVTQPLGLTVRTKYEFFDIKAFVSDITNWYTGGLHSSFFPGFSWFGLGYFYDANQYNNTLTPKISRFYDLDTVINVPKILGHDTLKSNAHIYELDFGIKFDVAQDFSVEVIAQLARKMAKGGVNGSVLKAPELSAIFNNFQFGLGYIMEQGRLIEGHFSSVYMSNRLMYEFTDVNTAMYWTQNNTLSSGRKAYGITSFFKWKPYRGTALDFSFRHDFLTRTPFMYLDDSDLRVDSVNTKNNFTFALSLLMNEKLVSAIKYAKIYLNQVHGAYYPKGGTYFASWGFNTGFDILTAPLFFNLAFEAGLNFTYIDLNNEIGIFGFPNNNIDDKDNLLEFFLGARWGFM